MRGSSVPGKKHVQGNPLEFHLRMFAAALREAGYRDRAMCSKLRLLADLGHWLKRTGQSLASNLEEHLLEAFVKHKQRMQQMHRGDSKTLQQFLAHLRKTGVVSSRKLIPDQSPLARILVCYEQHLLLERRLASATVFNYLSFARKFLVERFPEGPFLLNELRASDISDFVLRCCRGMSVGTTQIMTTAFRSFFRFLFQKGELQANLAACVPSVADRRLSTVPKYLTPEAVELVLKASNRSTAIGRRDYAGCGESGSATTSVAPSPIGANAHPDHESAACTSDERRLLLEEKAVQRKRASTVRKVSVSSLGRSPPARVVGATGPYESDD